MKNNPIVIICGEPNSIFSEIFYKSLNNYKTKKPIVVIGSEKLLLMQLRFLKKKMSFNNIFFRDNKIYNMKSDKINIINVDYNFKNHLKKFLLNQINIYWNVLKKVFLLLNL